MPDYWKLRDELASELKDIPGILSVGIGRAEQEIVLVVTVEGEGVRSIVPQQYKGVNVNVRDLGIGVMHGSKIKEKYDGRDRKAERRCCR